MGARTNFHFKQDENNTVTLYSHWGGDTKNYDLARALTAAQGRLAMGDTPYALRIMISQLIGDSWDSETGFGILVNQMDHTEEEYHFTMIDLTNNTVNDAGNIVSIQQFIDYYSRQTELV